MNPLPLKKGEPARPSQRHSMRPTRTGLEPLVPTDTTKEQKANITSDIGPRLPANAGSPKMGRQQSHGDPTNAQRAQNGATPRKTKKRSHGQIWPWKAQSLNSSDNRATPAYGRDLPSNDLRSKTPAPGRHNGQPQPAAGTCPPGPRNSVQKLTTQLYCECQLTHRTTRRTYA